MIGKKRVSAAPSRLRLLNEQGTQGVLLGTACRRCGARFFGGLVFCQSCTSSDMEPVEVSPRGTLYSYTIVRVPPVGWKGNVPYTLGQVETPEGPHVITEVVDSASELKLGTAMELALVVGGEDADGNELVVYKWRQPDRDQEE